MKEPRRREEERREKRGREDRGDGLVTSRWWLVRSMLLAACCSL